VSRKDKKAGRAALREFLIAIPGVLDRATASLGWLVVLVGIALAALLLHLAFGDRPHPPAPLPPILEENPQTALYARDLGRLADGRHTFDLVYAVRLRNFGAEPAQVDFGVDRLALGETGILGDIAELGHAPGLFDAPHATAGVTWRVVAHHGSVHGDCRAVQAVLERHGVIARGGADCEGALAGEILPGGERSHQAHYRVAARPDQIADVAIGFAMGPDRRDRPHGWFAAKPDADAVLDRAQSRDEEVQLGAVLRAHCPLGVKVHNGEVKSLCGA
jgi:hypothetical protein